MFEPHGRQVCHQCIKSWAIKTLLKFTVIIKRMKLHCGTLLSVSGSYERVSAGEDGAWTVARTPDLIGTCRKAHKGNPRGDLISFFLFRSVILLEIAIPVPLGQVLEDSTWVLGVTLYTLSHASRVAVAQEVLVESLNWRHIVSITLCPTWKAYLRIVPRQLRNNSESLLGYCTRASEHLEYVPGKSVSEMLWRMSMCMTAVTVLTGYLSRILTQAKQPQLEAENCFRETDRLLVATTA